MRKDPRGCTVVEVTLKNRPEYLSRVRRIAACIADCAGMDRRESDETVDALVQACTSSVGGHSGCGSDDDLTVRLTVLPGSLVTEVAHSTMDTATRICRSIADRTPLEPRDANSGIPRAGASQRDPVRTSPHN